MGWKGRLDFVECKILNTALRVTKKINVDVYVRPKDNVELA